MAQLAGYTRQTTTAVVVAGSVGASHGTVTLPVLRAPFGGLTITGARLAAGVNIAAGTANYITATLINGGTAGTATTAIGTAGGTAGVPGAGTVAPTAFTMSSTLNELTADQYLNLTVAMTGVLANNNYTAIIEWVRGQG